MDRISNRTGITFQSHHMNVVKEELIDNSLSHHMEKESKNFNFTCKAREYGPKMGRILQAFGFAVKIGDKFYNTKSLAKRMTQAILHCPVEKSSRKDKEDIQNTSRIWQKTLEEIGDKKTLSLEELNQVYEATLTEVASEFLLLEAKYKLLAINEDEQSFLVSILGFFDPEKGSLKEQLEQFGRLNFKEVLKEEWFKQECSKKDEEGKFLISSLFQKFENIKTEEDIDLMISILEIIGDPTLIQDAKDNLTNQANKWNEFTSYAQRKLNPLLTKFNIERIAVY